MRNYNTPGCVYVVTVEDKKCFFMYLSRDNNLLNADVIKVFRRKYSMEETPSIDEIVSDEVDFICHTGVNAGVHLGWWKKAGRYDGDLDLRIWFRSTIDEGDVSHNWSVWMLNGPLHSVGKLPKRFYTAYIGVIIPPEYVVEWIKTGEAPLEWYPGY